MCCRVVQLQVVSVRVRVAQCAVVCCWVVAMCGSAVQVCGSAVRSKHVLHLFSVVQCAVVCCSVLQCGAGRREANISFRIWGGYD